jgi:CRP/FNR family transcriptional regulator
MERLATFLLEATEQSAPADGRASNAIILPMGRMDIADYLGLTIETVSRLITRLRKRRIIELSGPQYIVLLAPRILRQISEGEV